MKYLFPALALLFLFFAFSCKSTSPSPAPVSSVETQASQGSPPKDGAVLSADSTEDVTESPDQTAA